MARQPALLEFQFLRTYAYAGCAIRCVKIPNCRSFQVNPSRLIFFFGERWLNSPASEYARNSLL